MDIKHQLDDYIIQIVYKNSINDSLFTFVKRKLYNLGLLIYLFDKYSRKLKFLKVQI